jgi:hypothetical protein
MKMAHTVRTGQFINDVALNFNALPFVQVPNHLKAADNVLGVGQCLFVCNTWVMC